jgi:ubiquinone/menaquinone biosynthesis C-methylase UbiE
MLPRLPEEIRQRAVADLYGRVLEIGAGAGANFPYYRSGTHVVAVEPAPHRRREAIACARAARAAIRVIDARTEQLPFADASFDAAVLTLVLCSVEDVPQSLAELRRVLRTGAPVHLVEHVRASDGLTATLQAWLTRLTRRLGGCHLDRCTVEAVRAAGFTIEQIQPHWDGLLVEVRARTPYQRASVRVPHAALAGAPA